MRNTADEFNMTNSINIDVVHFQGTLERPLITTERLTLDIEDYSKVFSTKVLTKSIDNERYLSSLTGRVQELMEKMDLSYDNKDADIFRVLDSLNIDTRIKNNIEIYLTYQGINRSNN